MWETKATILKDDEIIKYEIFRGNNAITRKEVIENWINNEEVHPYCYPQAAKK